MPNQLHCGLIDKLHSRVHAMSQTQTVRAQKTFDGTLGLGIQPTLKKAENWI